MAITIGTPTTGTSAATLTHTCAVGTRVLVVGMISSTGTNGGGSATWNGGAMSKAKGAATDCIALYYMLSPDTGSHDVAFTGPSGTTTTFAVDLAGDIGLGAPVNTGENSAGQTEDITTIVGSVVFDVGYCDMTSGSPTVGASQTEIINRDHGSTNYGVGSYETATGTTTTISWDGSMSVWVSVLAEFRIMQSQTLTDGAVATDTISKQPQRTLSDTATITDTLFQAGRAILTTLTDTATATDIIGYLKNGSATLWYNLSRIAASWSSQSESSAPSFTNQSKNSATFTEQDKSD